MILTPQERNNPLWLKLKAHFEERLQKLRVANDADMDERKRARHGGRIDELKSTLALDSDPPLAQDEALPD